MVAVKLVAVNDVVVFATVLMPEEKSLTSDHSQRVTEPMLPDRVNVVLFVPVQTVALPAIVPPTDAGETVIVADPLLVEEQAPLVTTAL